MGLLGEMGLKKNFLIIVGIGILFLVVLSIGILGFYMDWNTEKMATVLPGKQNQIGTVVDTYKGVPVYENGILFTETYGKNFSKDGYYYGQKWQCVEYVKRFYYDAKGHKMPNGFGNAKDFYNNGLTQGAYNKERGLYQYKNGGNVKPQPDDLMVFQTGLYGHVAIITQVNDNDIEVIQQNMYGNPRETYKIVIKDGNFFIGNGKQPVGWLRKAEAKTPI